MHTVLFHDQSWKGRALRASNGSYLTDCTSTVQQDVTSRTSRAGRHEHCLVHCHVVPPTQHVLDDRACMHRCPYEYKCSTSTGTCCFVLALFRTHCTRTCYSYCKKSRLALHKGSISCPTCRFISFHRHRFDRLDPLPISCLQPLYYLPSTINPCRSTQVVQPKSFNPVVYRIPHMH
jgi:hypothetical protein